MAELIPSSISKNSRFKNNITIHNRLIQWVYSKAEITSNVDWNSILKGANLIQVDWHYQSGGPIGAHTYMHRDTFCWSICDTQLQKSRIAKTIWGFYTQAVLYALFSSNLKLPNNYGGLHKVPPWFRPYNLAVKGAVGRGALVELDQRTTALISGRQRNV